MRCLGLFRKYSEDALVLTSNHKHICKVKLNKPKALNALCVPMMKTLQDLLNGWNSDPVTRVLLLSAEGNKAFCAGGDIRSLYEAKKQSRDSVLSEFFFKEYTLDYNLSRMKPIHISLWDGIVMGGGVGISIHAPFRIATESSVFSMPETAIGLYPDVGGSYFLSRLPGNLGLYLGITASRLTGKELVQAGLATHFVSEENLDAMKKKLIDQSTPDFSIKDVESIIEEFSTDINGPLEDIDNIDKYFGRAKKVEEIFDRLKDGGEWGASKLKRTEKLCPLSMKVTFEQLKRGRNMSLVEVFTMEYRLSSNFMQGEDFFEGFRAMLLDKDKEPKWQHKSLEEVSDDLVQSYFERPSSDFKDLDVDFELKKLKSIR